MGVGCEVHRIADAPHFYEQPLTGVQKRFTVKRLKRKEAVKKNNWWSRVAGRFGGTKPKLVQAIGGNWYSSVSGYNALEEYVKLPPQEQHALDLFKNEWSCRLPCEFEGLTAGESKAFEDPRIIWAEGKFNGFKDKRVLELGPLEGGHTYMVEKYGAASILSIEANKRAFMKCLIVKNLLEMSRSHFVLGDFVEYLRTSQEDFDCALASGVLYHMANPIEVLGLLSLRTKQLFGWTHYYVDSAGDAHPAKSPEFVPLEYKGFQCRGLRHYYGDVLKMPGFCGGNLPSSVWMRRDDLIAGLRHFGFNEVDMGLEEPHHPGGPALCFVARKT
jgi:hypothetical protein